LCHERWIIADEVIRVSGMIYRSNAGGNRGINQGIMSWKYKKSAKSLAVSWKSRTFVNRKLKLKDYDRR